MILQLGEIRPGVVAHLDPAVLNSYSAQSPLPVLLRVAGVHPFLCVHSGDVSSLWVAMTSSSSRGRRVLLPREFKHGDRRWIETNTYIYGPAHWFQARPYIFQEASEPERSHVCARNGITPEGVEFVLIAVPWTFRARAA